MVSVSRSDAPAMARAPALVAPGDETAPAFDRNERTRTRRTNASGRLSRKLTSSIRKLRVPSEAGTSAMRFTRSTSPMSALPTNTHSRLCRVSRASHAPHCQSARSTIAEKLGKYKSPAPLNSDRGQGVTAKCMSPTLLRSMCMSRYRSSRSLICRKAHSWLGASQLPSGISARRTDVFWPGAWRLTKTDTMSSSPSICKPIRSRCRLQACEAPSQRSSLQISSSCPSLASSSLAPLNSRLLKAA